MVHYGTIPCSYGYKRVIPRNNSYKQSDIQKLEYIDYMESSHERIDQLRDMSITNSNLMTSLGIISFLISICKSCYYQCILIDMTINRLHDGHLSSIVDTICTIIKGNRFSQRLGMTVIIYT